MMIIKVNRSLFLVFFYVAAISIVKNACEAASSISTNMSSLEERNKTRLVSASVQIDFEDLFNMTEISFSGMENGNDAATYTKTTASMRTTSSGEKEIIWNGMLIDTSRTGFATLVQSADRSVIGTMTTDTTTYHLVTMPNGQTQLRAMDWVDSLVQGDYDDGKQADSTGQTDPDVTIAAAGYFAIDQSGFDTMLYSEGTATSIVGPGNGRLLRGERELQTGPTIDILLLITNRAMCEYAGQNYPCELTSANRAPIEGVVPMLQTQTNDSIQSVNGQAQVRIVNVIHLTSSFDGRPTISTLNVIRDDANVQDWRNEYGADLVAMLTGDDPTAGGIAYIESHESATAASQIQFYAFQHEIAHNIGSLHDRLNTEQRHPYAHGLQVPGRFRTIMAYPCQSSRCSTIPYFSADGFSFRGIAIGDIEHDNARRIRENAPAIAAFRAPANPPTPSVSPPVNPPITTTQPPPGNPPTTGTQDDDDDNGGSCFSGDNFVEIKGRGLVKMDTVKIGEYVKDSANSFSRLYSYSHIDRNIEATFVQLRSEGIDQPLELSHDHLVYISLSKTLKAVRGKDVKIGDELIGYNGTRHKVTSTESVKREGVFAPLTESGNIVVSGLIASSYVALLHYSTSVQNYATHAVLSPLRLVCNINFKICENEKYTDGLSNFILRIIYLVRHVAKYSVCVQLLLTIEVAPLILFAYFTEQVLMMATTNLLVIFAIGAVSWIFLFLKTKDKKNN